MHGAPASSLYEGFYKVGLQYGPTYRTLVQVWRSENTIGLGRLEARMAVQGTRARHETLHQEYMVTPPRSYPEST